MKSYFLTDIRRPDLLSAALSRELRVNGGTWILADAAGDPIAYFSIVGGNSTLDVQADISGRHYYEDCAVTEVLEKIGAIVGGTVQNDE